MNEIVQAILNTVTEFNVRDIIGIADNALLGIMYFNFNELNSEELAAINQVRTILSYAKLREDPAYIDSAKEFWRERTGVRP